MTALRKLRAAAADDAGFTLIEMIIALLIGSVIVAAIGAALTVSLDNQNSQKANLTDARHADLAASYFAHDVASALGGISFTTTACDGGTGAVLNLAWQDLQTASVQFVSYAVRNTTTLDRISCGASTKVFPISNNLASAGSANVSCQPVSCTKPTSITLNVTQATDANLFSTAPRKFSLTGATPQPTTLSGGVPVPPPLLILGTGAGAVNLAGNGSLCVQGGSGVIDSTDPSGLELQGTQSTYCGAISMPGSGGCDPTGGATCPTVTTTDPVADPFAGVATPTCSGTGSVSGSNYHPGTFASAVSVTNNATFAAGTYCFQNGLSVGSNGSITGTGVLLVIKGGQYKLSGGGKVDLSPPTSGSYQGFVLWQPASNTNVTLPIGNTDSYYRGIYYTPSVSVSVTGNGVLHVFQLIANGITFQGTVGGVVAG